MKPLYEKYSSCTPIATIQLTNTSCIALFKPDEGDVNRCDFVSAYWDDINGYSRFIRTKVHTKFNNRLYILKNNKRYYLDNVQ